MIAGGERRLAARTTFEFTFLPDRRQPIALTPLMPNS
jgi:hypothetical protein